MLSLDKLKQLKDIRKSNPDFSYAECIAELLKGKVVEIYFGDMYEVLNSSDCNTQLAMTVIGEIIDAAGQVLVIDSFYTDKSNNTIKRGNILYLNDYSIKIITEISDDHGTLYDALMSVQSAKKLLRDKAI